MKTALLALALLTLLPARGALAHSHDDDGPTIHILGCDSPARWSDRIAPHDANLAITTRDGDVTLLLTDAVVAVQLSDHVLHKIQRKLRDARDDDEDNALGQSIKIAVLSSVSALLDHSAEVSIDDVRDVEYRHGRLCLISEDGDYIFDGIEVSDRDVMRSFSEHDAQAFVREFRRVKGNWR
jgi:hypothetical protein